MNSNALAFGSLQIAIERHLRELGYEICGDDEHSGWTWRLGHYDSSSSAPAFDSIDEATAAAVQDLVSRTAELVQAGQLVVDRWERGDLAEAVRELAACVQALSAADDEAATATGTALDGEAPVARVQSAWLVQGDSDNEPWIDAVFLELGAAIARCRAIGAEWQAEGHEVDLDELEARLRGEEHHYVLASNTDMEICLSEVALNG